MCEGAGKTFATNRTNEGYLDRWILPRWSSYRLRDVKAVIVEEWLRSLPLANGSKAKIRNLMHAVFNHAVRWEWHDKNPITQVRQSAKRQKVPIVLNIEHRAAPVAARTSQGAGQDRRTPRHSHRLAGE
jgi:integrase